MHTMMRKRKSLLLLGAACMLVAGPARAHEGHDHPEPTHGGTVVMSKAHHFEVVFAKDGVKVYPLAPADAPAVVAKLSGTATFTVPGAAKPFAYRLQPVTSKPATALGAAVDLGKMPAQGVKVAIQVGGLPDPAEPTANFTVPFALGDAAPALTVVKATKADDRAIAAQKVCKVSGEALDSMGGPLKVTLGGRTTFVCCKGCVKDLKADPDKYLGAATPRAGAGKPE